MREWYAQYHSGHRSSAGMNIDQDLIDLSTRNTESYGDCSDSLAVVAIGLDLRKAAVGTVHLVNHAATLAPPV